MMRHFINLAYRGENFHGWQRQPNATSVQQAVEEALAMVFRQNIPIVGAGRTDAGVNASMMIAHCDLPSPVADEKRLVRALNSILGHDITIYSIHQVAPDAHARFDATARTYHYYAHTRRTPFSSGLSWLAPADLDFNMMNRAAQLLLHTEDFTSFSKLHTDVKTNICNVSRAIWRPSAGPLAEIAGIRPETDATNGWVFEITADRFLRNMVRAVVGTLIDVGRGKITLDKFSDVIERRDRCAAGTSMPPGPLFLHRIEYPYPI